MKKEGEIIPKYTNFASLKAAIQQKMYNAVQDATEQSFQDLKSNVENFYDVPEGRYKRTDQLRDSPQLDGIDFNDDVAVGQISINTSTQYDPSSRDTETIYGYAEAGGLLGNGGFFERTKEQIEDNIKTSFGKYFK